MIKQTAGRDALNDFAPKFAQLNDDVLFGEVWSREDKLPLKTRSIVTLTALISKGIVDSSLSYHLSEARKNGVTRGEMAEILTHLAFYAGWPNAWAAFRMAKGGLRRRRRTGIARRLFRSGRTERGLCPLFHRKQLFKTAYRRKERSRVYRECDVRAALPK